ncbi:Paladin [Cichlidogyrus casuarinus]|uniref:Paladin n=1 Tax=Cichlidogyrus casuarinus TaxID=1844966 RepID=A0ABD2PMQ1_9PLAT
MEKLPLFCCAQPPNGKSVAELHCKLAGASKKCLWVSLRTDIVLTLKKTTCVWREGGVQNEQIQLIGVSQAGLENYARKLAITINCWKTIDIQLGINSTNKETVNLQEFPVGTLKSLFDDANLILEQQTMGEVKINNANQSNTLEIEESFSGPIVLERIPFGANSMPDVKFFDAMHSLMTKFTKSDNHLFIFFCNDGKMDSSYASLVAALSYISLKDVPMTELNLVQREHRSYSYINMRQDENETLREYQYFHGRFRIIDELVRLLPNGNDVKAKVDTLIDMSAMNTDKLDMNIRENIYRTLKQASSEENTIMKYQLYRKAINFLECYFYLFLFEAYLVACKSDQWKESFEKWLFRIGRRTGVVSLLDRFSLPEITGPDSILNLQEYSKEFNTIRERARTPVDAMLKSYLRGTFM